MDTCWDSVPFIERLPKPILVSCSDTLAAWDPGYGISVDTKVKCVPSAETTWWDQFRLGLNSLTVVSLGPITCPSA